MIVDGLWQDRRQRLPSPHQPRRRRECLGELVQIDGSEHAWFEDRAPPRTVLAFVDDATSRLMQVRFVSSESAFDYFRTTRADLEQHGKPVAFYSDKHGIFRVNSKDAIAGEGITQFGRALSALNIDIICANSPQAKGRIERTFSTLQDRMVKELRLAGISSIAGSEPAGVGSDGDAVSSPQGAIRFEPVPIPRPPCPASLAGPTFPVDPTRGASRCSCTPICPAPPWSIPPHSPGCRRPWLAWSGGCWSGTGTKWRGRPRWCATRPALPSHRTARRG